VHNIDTAYIGRELGYVLHGGYGLNIVNSWALGWAKEFGFKDMELSPEIDLRRIEKLRKAIPVGMIRYGYLPLMITRNAPAGFFHPSCKNDDFLQDRKNEKFPILHREGYHEIVNCVPILMPQEEYKAMDGVFNAYRFTVENSVEKMKKSLEKLRENHGFERITHGLYCRGVKNLTIQ
jgi:putative protease